MSARCPNQCAEKFLIGVEVQGVYDGVLFWYCDDCGERWHRWPEGTRQRVAAAPYVLALNNSPASPRNAITDSATEAKP